VARRLTANAWAAEDLVQDCLLLAWRNFHQFRRGTNARAWLFRILFNRFYADARKRLPDVVAIDAGMRIAVPACDETVGVSRALDSLPLEHRTVLMLGVVEGFTCGEIAGILGVPVGTVMSRLSRARQSMRQKLTARRQVTMQGAVGRVKKEQ
jgi:RNA polymerase sigma-70 factor (ECF subfamily)